MLQFPSSGDENESDDDDEDEVEGVNMTVRVKSSPRKLSGPRPDYTKGTNKNVVEKPGDDNSSKESWNENDQGESDDVDDDDQAKG